MGYDFTDFEGEDKWERFNALSKKMHREAVNEFFLNVYKEAKLKGEDEACIPISKGIILKDGSRLTHADMYNYSKEHNWDLSSAHEDEVKKYSKKNDS